MSKHTLCLGAVVLVVLCATGLWRSTPVRQDIAAPVPPHASEPATPEPSRHSDEAIATVVEPAWDTSGIHGQVVGAGVPMPDMRVYVDRKPYEGPCVCSGVTDRQGAFAAQVAETGEYRVLAANATHFGQIGVTWPDDQAAMPLTVAVDALGQVSGRTVDKHGQPVPHATVRISQDGRTLIPPVQSDEHGRFSTGFPWRAVMFWPYDEIVFCATQGDRAGSYILLPEDPRHEHIYHLCSKEESEEVAQPEPIRLGNIVIPLETACTLAGCVVNQRKEPMPHACVAAMAGDHRWPLEVEADENGAFVLPGVPPGHYTFRVYKSRTEPYELVISESNHPVAATAGGRIDDIVVKVSLCEETCRGRVSDPMGRPVEGAQVSADLLNRMAIRGDGRTPFLTNANGTFFMGELHAGDYLLKVTCEGYVDYLSPKPVAVPDQNVSITLVPKTYIHGRVLDAGTATPVEGARLTVFLDAEQGPESGPLLAVTIGGEPGGEFTFELPGTGDFVLRAIADGYQVAELPFTASPGDLLEDLLLTMSPAEAASGFLTDANGAPVSASLFFSQPGFAGVIRTASEEDGSFIVDGLAPGPGAAVAGIDRNLQYTLPFDHVPGKHIDLVLPRGGVLRGSVTRNGEPITLADASLFCPHQTFSKEFINFRAGITGETFRFEDVPAGTHMLEIEVAGIRGSYAREVTVREGTETTANIELNAGGGSVEGVLTLNGAPYGQSSVLVKSVAAGALPVQTMLAGAPDAEGHYRIDGVPSGKAVLNGLAELEGDEDDAGGFCSRQFAIDVPENGVVRQDITLSMRGTVLVTVDGVNNSEHVAVLALTETVTLEQLEYLLNVPQCLTEILASRRLPRGQTFARLDNLCPGTVRIAAIVTSSGDGLDYFPCPRTPIRQAETIITIPEDITAEDVIEVNLRAE